MTAANPYAGSIDDTRQTLIDRSRAYRSLVIVVACWILIVGAAAVARPPLLVLAALLPCFVSVYAAHDLRSVDRWRSRVLAHWREGSVRLPLFASTLRQVPFLPKGTIEGMLECLPDWPDAVAPPLRTSLVQAQVALGRLAVQRLALRAIAWACGGLALMGWRADLLPLALPAAAFAVAVLAAWPIWSRRQLGLAIQAAVREWPAARSDDAAACALRDGINLQGIPAALAARWRDGVLAAFRQGA
jgi:hypothetical protein